MRPATVACVPSPPATPSRSAPFATAWRATSATFTRSGPLMRKTSAPSSSALRLRSNLPTLPPPDRGFMIRNGRVAMDAGWNSGIRQSAALGASATLAASPASSHAAADAAATQSRFANANAMSAAIGDAMSRPRASQRRRPRPARNQKPAARLTAALATPMASIAMLASPPSTARTATAAAARRKLRRASHRRAGLRPVSAGGRTSSTSAANANLPNTPQCPAGGPGAGNSHNLPAVAASASPGQGDSRRRRARGARLLA
jgi:hypothetical protein